MTKHVLVAFDDSDNAMRAVDFVGTYLAKDCRITVFTILPDTEAICAMQSPELTAYFKSQQMTFCALEDQKKKLVEEALARAKSILVGAGFEAGRIDLKAVPKKKGIAQDIILEAGSGYDLLVMGRRGLSGVKDFFFGSISQKVLHSLKDVSVLVIN